MSLSTISVSETHNQRFTSYTALLGTPSSGKSPALKIFSKAAYEIEKHQGKTDETSNLANGGTVEAVIEMLKHNRSLLSYYDEGNFR